MNFNKIGTVSLSNSIQPVRINYSSFATSPGSALPNLVKLYPPQVHFEENLNCQQFMEFKKGESALFLTTVYCHYNSNQFVSHVWG